MLDYRVKLQAFPLRGSLNPYIAHWMFGKWV